MTELVIYETEAGVSPFSNWFEELDTLRLSESEQRWRGWKPGISETQSRWVAVYPSVESTGDPGTASISDATAYASLFFCVPAQRSGRIPP